MPKSSFGPRRGDTSRAATYKPKVLPRIVRLGRPANDNFRRPGFRAWMSVAGIAGALLALLLADWRFF